MVQVELLPWDAAGLELLRSMNTAEQKAHLGGPEPDAKLLERQGRYLTCCKPGEAEMLLISVKREVVAQLDTGKLTIRVSLPMRPVEVLPAVHGKGIGSGAGVLLIERLRIIAKHQLFSRTPLQRMWAPTVFAGS